MWESDMSVIEILMQKDAGRGPSTYEYFDGPVAQRFCDQGSGVFTMPRFRGELWRKFPCRRESTPPSVDRPVAARWPGRRSIPYSRRAVEDGNKLQRIAALGSLKEFTHVRSRFA